MDMQSMKSASLYFYISSFLLIGILTPLTSAIAQIDMSRRPALIITNDPMPGTGSDPFVQPQKQSTFVPRNTGSITVPRTMPPSSRPVITPQQITGSAYFQPTNTIVGREIANLQSDLASLQSAVSNYSSQLANTQNRNESLSAEYYASVATINTQLQSGTTPGNPRLVQRLTTAQQNLDNLAQNIANLNTLAVELANSASMASFLLESIRSTYSLSGAVEEDHDNLRQIEDQVNAMIVNIDRLLNDVNDGITRTAAYLNSERNNMRSLSLAVTNGDFYGGSLANKNFTQGTAANSLYQPASLTPAGSMERRPLAKIRFDRSSVDFEQPVYMAVSEALERYPNASFEVIAVNPTRGNAAQVAIESTRARRNAEKVLRTLGQLGLPMNRVNLSHSQSPEASTSEVHIFLL